MPPPAEIVETHISVIAMIGDRAYKLMKPVSMAFLDHRRREDRLDACRRETEVNRRFAPDVYLGVLDVIDDDGHARDHLIEMRRMPASRPPVGAARRRRRARPRPLRGARDRRLPPGGAHLAPDRRGGWPRRGARAVGGGTRPAGGRGARGRAPRGGRARAHPGPGVPGGPARPAGAAHRRGLGARRPRRSPRRRRLLPPRRPPGARLPGLRRPVAARRRAGRRRLPGDGPRGGRASRARRDARGRVAPRSSASPIRPPWPTTTSPTGPTSGRRSPRCVPDRATRARGRTPAGSTPSPSTHLECAQVRMVLVGGAPGTGKSTLARALGDATGWAVLRSDETRKDLAGLPRTPADPGRFGAGLYAPEVSDRVYAEMLDRAAGHLALGESVVLDASWSAGARRAAARRVASECHAEAIEIRCHLAPAIANARIRSRRAAGEGSSDATPEIAERLAASADPWPEARSIGTDAPPGQVLREARRLVGPVRCRDRRPSSPRGRRGPLRGPGGRGPLGGRVDQQHRARGVVGDVRREAAQHHPLHEAAVSRGDDDVNSGGAGPRADLPRRKAVEKHPRRLGDPAAHVLEPRLGVAASLHGRGDIAVRARDQGMGRGHHVDDAQRFRGLHPPGGCPRAAQRPPCRRGRRSTRSCCRACPSRASHVSGGDVGRRV